MWHVSAAHTTHSICYMRAHKVRRGFCSEGSMKDFIASDEDEATGAGNGAAEELVADFLEGARHKQDSELVRRV